MRRAVKQILVSGTALLVLCVICRLFFFRTYTVRYHLYPSGADGSVPAVIQAEPEKPGIVRIGGYSISGNTLSLRVIPEKPGKTFLALSDAEGNRVGYVSLRVSRFRTLYEGNTGGFSGDTAAMVASTLFWLLTGAIMAWNFFQTRGPSFYRYQTIYLAGFSVFALITGLCLLEVTIRHLLDPGSYSMLYVYSALSGASPRFLQLTAPLVLAFAAAMAVSNAALLRHERPRFQNVLGILVGLLLVAGLYLGWRLISADFSGSEEEGRIFSVLQNTYATLFVYCECMLAGSVVCGLLAARHRPAPDKDFIIILGCWFRRDGSLPPLLRGRVDRALSFWREQKKSTGREACFIPSGGQGRDESMPEAEAMRRYLLSQGVPDRLILPETASRSTLENMTFSGRIIREANPDGKTVFSTTSYHVFRSGVWAAEAGLPAEGIGSRTKWWFWPNAFMRETVGLLLKRWKQELLLLAVLVAYFALLTFLLG